MNACDFLELGVTILELVLVFSVAFVAGAWWRYVHENGG